MSRTNPSIPSDIFLLIIDPQIKGIESIVPVMSLRAYIFLSAGQIDSVCDIIQTPDRSTLFLKSAIVRFVLKPGIVSSLSIVPPVCPRLRPASIGTAIPSEARIGPRIIETLSPTPPVECLSATNDLRSEKSMVSPELIIIRVRETISSLTMPF